MDFERIMDKIIYAAAIITFGAIITFKVDNLEDRMSKIEAGDTAIYTTTTPSKYSNFVGLDKDKPSEVVQDFTPPEELKK